MESDRSIILALSRELNALQRILREINDKYSFLGENLHEHFKECPEMTDTPNRIIIRIRPDGIITCINPCAERLFGYASSDVVGKNIVGTLIPDGGDLESFIRDVGNNSRQYMTGENESVTRDGKRVWIEWTNRKFTDDAGGITEIVCVGNDITARKETENAYEKIERKYRVLFETSNDPIAVISEDGRILDINQAGLDLFGYSREEALKLCVREVFADTGEHLMLRELLDKEGTARNFEIRFRKRNGEIIDCMVTSNVFEICGDSPRCFQTFITDLTEQKRVKSVLRELERRLSIILESIPDIVYRLTPEKKISFISDSINKYGYTPEELIGKNIYDIVHPDDLKKAHIAIAERRTGERRTRSLEIRFLVKSRENMPIRMDSRNMEMDPAFRIEAEGLYRGDQVKTENFIGTQGVARDITELKRAERKIRENEELYRALFETDSEAVLLIDQETGKILDVNSAGERIYGYSRDEFTRLTRNDIWVEPIEHRPEENQDQNGAQFHRHRKKNGSLFPAEVAASEIEHLGQRLCLCAVRDITDRLRAEEEVLLRERLEGALQMAHAVCHEINQPLQIVSGYTQLMHNEISKADPNSRYLREIQEAVDRMAEITKKLNTITRRETAG